MRALVFLGKDVRLLLRNRALVVALVLYPLLLAVVLGSAFQEAPTRLDLVVVNHDAGGESIRVGEDELTSEDLLAAAAGFAFVRNATTDEEALAILRKGEADAVLIIPPRFVADLGALGRDATLQLVVDESDPVRATISRTAVMGGIDAFLQSVVARKIADVEELLGLTLEGGKVRILLADVDVLGVRNARARIVDVGRTLDPQSAEAKKLQEVVTFLDFAGGALVDSGLYLRTTAVPVRVATTGLAAEDTRLTAIALPGAIVLGVFWTGALATAFLLSREGETGAGRRLAAAPGSRALPLVTKVLVGWLAAILPALLLLALGVSLLDALVVSPALAILALAAASFAAAGVGALASGLARGSAAAALLAILGLLPMLLLAGLFYPVAYMPAAAQAVAHALPVTLATEALRGAMLRGADVAILAPTLGGLVAWGLAAGSAGVLASRR